MSYQRIVITEFGSPTVLKKAIAMRKLQSADPADVF